MGQFLSHPDPPSFVRHPYCPEAYIPITAFAHLPPLPPDLSPSPNPHHPLQPPHWRRVDRPHNPKPHRSASRTPSLTSDLSSAPPPHPPSPHIRRRGGGGGAAAAAAAAAGAGADPWLDACACDGRCRCRGAGSRVPFRMRVNGAKMEGVMRLDGIFGAAGARSGDVGCDELDGDGEGKEKEKEKGKEKEKERRKKERIRSRRHGDMMTGLGEIRDAVFRGVESLHEHLEEGNGHEKRDFGVYARHQAAFEDGGGFGDVESRRLRRPPPENGRSGFGRAMKGPGKRAPHLWNPRDRRQMRPGIGRMAWRDDGGLDDFDDGLKGGARRRPFGPRPGPGGRGNGFDDESDGDEEFMMSGARLDDINPERTKPPRGYKAGRRRDMDDRHDVRADTRQRLWDDEGRQSQSPMVNSPQQMVQPPPEVRQHPPISQRFTTVSQPLGVSTFQATSYPPVDCKLPNNGAQAVSTATYRNQLGSGLQPGESHVLERAPHIAEQETSNHAQPARPSTETNALPQNTDNFGFSPGSPPG